MGRLTGEEVGPDNERSCISMTGVERAIIDAAIVYVHSMGWREMGGLIAKVREYEKQQALLATKEMNEEQLRHWVAARLEYD